MHYLHILAKLLGFSWVWPELCIMFSVNTGFSPSVTWIALHSCQRNWFVLKTHVCNSYINKFCEFSFLKWITFVLTPICSQFIRFQNAEHAWVMDRWTVNYKHKWLYIVICLWLISWAYKKFVPAINELNSIEEYKITQNVFWNDVFQILLSTQINLFEIIDVLHFCFFM